jgi:hypothetical protein
MRYDSFNAVAHRTTSTVFPDRILTAATVTAADAYSTVKEPSDSGFMCPRTNGDVNAKARHCHEVLHP